MDHHSDQNYLVDASLFGSASARSTGVNNKHSRNQILFRGQFQNLEEDVQICLSNIGVQLETSSISILNITEGCLVKFKSYNEAERVMNDLLSEDNKRDNRITVEWHEPKDERNVYVKNLPMDFGEDQLKDLFKSYGPIISTKIMKKEQNNNSIGFVRFQNKAEAEMAINTINMQQLHLISSDRSVHCELSKVNSSGTTVRATQNKVPSDFPMYQGYSVGYPANPFSPYTIVSPAFNPNLVSITHHQQMFNQTLQMPSLYGPAVQTDVMGSLPQTQAIQQVYNNGQIIYIPYNSYGPNQY